MVFPDVPDISWYSLPVSYLPFQTDSFKYFRMLRLRYRHIEIPVKLLHKIVVMRMNHPGFCIIINTLSVLYHLRCIQHIFIKYSFSTKPPFSIYFFRLYAAHTSEQKYVFIPISFKSDFLFSLLSAG